MSSSFKTYGRKRKETAEEKFDAIFGPRSEDNAGTSKTKKLKKEESTFSYAKKTSNSAHCSASAQFDALFGSPESKASTSSSSPEKRKACSPKNGRSPSKDIVKKLTLSPAKKDSSKDSFCAVSSSPEESSNQPVRSPITNATMQSKLVNNKKRIILNYNRRLSRNSLSSSQPTTLISDEISSASAKNTLTSTQPSLVFEKPANTLTSSTSDTKPFEKTNSPTKAATDQPSKMTFYQKKLEPLHVPKTKLIGTKDQREVVESTTVIPVKSASPVKSMNGCNRSILSKKSSLMGTSKVNNGKVCYNPRSWIKDGDEDSSILLKSGTDVKSSQLASIRRQQQLSMAASSSSAMSMKSTSGAMSAASNNYKMQPVEIVTYVKNVKNFQNCLEEGEAQEFADEVDYMMEGLQITQSASNKCLLISSFTTKCTNSSFMYYLKAHAVLSKVFPLIADAPSNKSLALATSGLLYVLSRDHQSDLDKATLDLLFRLLDPLGRECSASTNAADSAVPSRSESSKQQPKKYNWRNKERSTGNNGEEHGAAMATTTSGDSVDSSYATVQQKLKGLVTECEETLVDKTDITIKSLCAESLMRYALRPSVPDWFREMIRLKGGLDHIINTIKKSVDVISKAYPEAAGSNVMTDDTSSAVNSHSQLKERKHFCIANRLVKVLDKGVTDCPTNGSYLVTYQRPLLLKSLFTAIKTCQYLLPRFPPAAATASFPSAAADTEECSSGTIYGKKRQRRHGKSEMSDNLLLSEVIKQIVKLLIDTSNDNEWVSSRIGEQEGLLRRIVSCVFDIPAHIDHKHRFEMIILNLSLIANMVEGSASNRISFAAITLHPASVTSLNYRHKMPVAAAATATATTVDIMQALIMLFYYHEMAARDNEILGQDGVKRAAAEAKRKGASGAHTAKKPTKKLQLFENGCHDDVGGQWKMSDDGLEWIPSEDTDGAGQQQVSDKKKMVNPRNPESNLTSEEKKEMNDALEKANDHLEKTMIASYVGLVIGCMIRGNRANCNRVRPYLLNDEGFKPMIVVLKKMLHFMSLTEGMTKKGEGKLKEIIEDLEECEHDFQRKRDKEIISL